uniref:Uncharacterized protein n=1 Tax=Timema tahoe TaxID=61484 RepID=A0A7R9IQM6_9NEOP|nr:unnamed protein product [Timema tahoe]
MDNPNGLLLSRIHTLVIRPRSFNFQYDSRKCGKNIRFHVRIFVVLTQQRTFSRIETVDYHTSNNHEFILEYRASELPQRQRHFRNTRMSSDAFQDGEENSESELQESFLLHLPVERGGGGVRQNKGKSQHKTKRDGTARRLKNSGEELRSIEKDPEQKFL